MKAIIVKDSAGFSSLTTIDKSDPEVAAGHVLVSWHATSLNYHDYLVANGSIPVEAGRIPMSDGAGEVVGVGDGVETWKIGDRVMSLFFPNWLGGRPTPAATRDISGESVDGYLCENSVVKATALTRIPDGYSYAEAATLPCAAVTAWRGLMVEGKLKPGQSVLVEGTGGVSIFALQLALAAGGKVYATTSSPAKAKRLEEMGVELVINYREDERWGRTIYKAAGKGVNHVIDVGGGTTFRHSVDAAAMDGHIASIGILSGRSGDIVFPKLFFKHLRISGLAVGNRKMQEDLVEFIDAQKIKPVISKRFAFSEIIDAFRYQETGSHFGKIVVEW